MPTRVLRLLLVLLLAGLAGCQATGAAQQKMSDESITAAVQNKLTADRLSNFTRVDVDTEGGVVQLSGTVLSAEQRKRAEELARQVHGVLRVKNNLRIQNQSMRTGRLNE